MVNYFFVMHCGSLFLCLDIKFIIFFVMVCHSNLFSSGMVDSRLFLCSGNFNLFFRYRQLDRFSEISYFGLPYGDFFSSYGRHSSLLV